ncbi:hypothetical protein GCK72_009268 [Caenorhabditis remanei]|uniref:F-box associated domain-containing protein n=1 Tax=Caenorhabditis remanei TaxID=31234 RepID=A0A6A5H242_CAERE|nr:hypothetical protein GCK72_009268 [Caenorhabditis remanei]KAF1761015.1 hypothetical protein GCK72_009268 [Caenorhabditis remanei]
MIWFDFTSGVPSDEMKEERTVGACHFKHVQKISQKDVEIDQFNIFYLDVQKGMAELSKHLVYIFPGPIQTEFSVIFSQKFGELFAYEHMQQLETLRIVGGIMLKNLLEQVFGNLKIQKKLVVEPDTDDEYVIEQAFQIDELFLANARSWTQDHLLRMECRIAHLYDHFFGYDEIRSFAENWLLSLNLRTERVCFGWRNRSTVLEFDDLRTKKWDRTQRERKYLYYEKNELHRVDCTNGLDIQRHDGELATLVYWGRSIYFLVWNERFPEKKRLSQLPEKLASHYKKLEELNREYTDSSSLERLLSNSSLRYDEFVDTYKVLRGMDAEVRLSSVGRSLRRRVFDQMYEIIDYQDYLEIG